jgi:hypothetical protein
VHELSLQSGRRSVVADASARLIYFHEQAQAKGERKLRKRLDRLRRADRFWREDKAKKAQAKQPRFEVL